MQTQGTLTLRTRLTVSKKDIQVRRQELLEFFSDDLITTATLKTEELMRDPLAIQVVQEIILYSRGAEPSILAEHNKYRRQIGPC